MSEFKPVLYMKKGCPWCTKVAVFLADAGLQHHVVWDYDIDAIEPTLLEKLGNCTFPALQYAPGEYMLESGDIIKRYADQYNVDVNSLVSYQFFVQENDESAPSMMKSLLKLFHYAVQKEGGYEQAIAAVGL